MRPVQVLPVVLAAAIGCQPAGAKDTSAEAKQAIDAANANWARLTAAGHADSLADFYHPNGVMLPPNMAPVRGREAIRTFMTAMNAPPSPTLSVRADSVWASSPLAVEVGRWHYATPAGAKLPPGVPATDSGKYMVRWMNENGRWSMVQDIWNSDTPLPMPKPAASPSPKK
jgi:uncharacterized protein (TIGR02246 family)